MTARTGTARCSRSPGSAIDFVIVHWYPERQRRRRRAGRAGSAPRRAVAAAERDRRSTAAPNGSHLGVALTEVNAGVDEDTQPDALFGADTYLTALENGVFTVDWWDTHNGPTRSAPRPTAPPTTTTGACCPAAPASARSANRRSTRRSRATTRISMLSKLGRPGDQMVARRHRPAAGRGARRDARPTANLAVHAGEQGPEQRLPGQPALRRLHAERRDADRLHVRRRGNRDHLGVAGNQRGQTLPPYSIETSCSPRPASAVSALTAPGAPRPSRGSPARQATVSWTPSTGGPVDPLRGLPAVRHDQRAARRVDLHLRDAQQPGARHRLHAQRAGHRPERATSPAPRPRCTFTTSTPAAQHLRRGLPGHRRLGQRLRRLDHRHRHRPEPDQRLDADLHLPGRHRDPVSSGWNANWTSSGQNVARHQPGLGRRPGGRTAATRRASASSATTPGRTRPRRRSV